jgi:hypothetical protein
VISCAVTYLQAILQTWYFSVIRVKFMNRFLEYLFFMKAFILENKRIMLLQSSNE